jgi:hypothetical protein
LNILVVTSDFAKDYSSASNHVTGRIKDLIRYKNTEFFVVTETISTSSAPCPYKTIDTKRISLYSDKIIRKIYSKLGIHGLSDNFANWNFQQMYEQAIEQELKRHNYDLIYSTGGPAVVHLAASKVLREHRLPWIAEIQDPLVFDGLKSVSYNASKRDMKALHNAELAIAEADAVICLTKACCNMYKDRLHKKAVYCIYPGYARCITKKEHKLETIKEKRLILFHAGTLYGDRNLDRLVCAIESAGLQDEIILRVAGYIDNNVKKAIKRGSSFIDYLGVIPGAEVSKQIKSCHLCLVIQNTSNISKYTIPFKFYEYAAAGMPILFLGYRSNEAMENSIVYNYYYADMAEQGNIINSLQQLIKENKNGNLKIPIAIDIEDASRSFLKVCNQVIEY